MTLLDIAQREGNIGELEVDTGQMSTGVEIMLQISNNILIIAKEQIQ